MDTNNLRLLAEDIHSAAGHNAIASALSLSADKIERLQDENDAMRDEIGELRDACAEKQRCIDSSVAAQRAFLAEIDALRAELAATQAEVKRLTHALRRIYCVDAEWSTPPTKSVAERMHDIATAALLLKARKGEGE